MIQVFFKHFHSSLQSVLCLDSSFDRIQSFDDDDDDDEDENNDDDGDEDDGISLNSLQSLPVQSSQSEDLSPFAAF